MLIAVGSAVAAVILAWFIYVVAHISQLTEISVSSWQCRFYLFFYTGRPTNSCQYSRKLFFLPFWVALQFLVFATFVAVGGLILCIIVLGRALVWGGTLVVFAQWIPKGRRPESLD